MTKEILIQEIKKLKLETQMEEYILELIHNSPEVDKTLMTMIMGLLDAQVALDEIQADLAGQEADVYDEALQQLQEEPIESEVVEEPERLDLPTNGVIGVEHAIAE